MRSRSSLDQAFSDIERGIELFERTVQGKLTLTHEERKRLARDALEVRMQFDGLLADLLAELQRRQQTRRVAEALRSSNEAG